MSTADTLVSSILHRAPRTVSMDDPLSFVRDLMASEHIHHVVVVDGGAVVGVVSDRDVLRAVSPVADNGRVAREADVATLRKRVHQVMSHRLVTVTPETRMARAVELMLEHGIHSVPVVDEAKHPVGIVTSTDAMRWCLELAAEATAALPAA